jgi:hypothetical protein
LALVAANKTFDAGDIIAQGEAGVLLTGRDQEGLLQGFLVKGNIAVRGSETIFNFHSNHYYEKRPLFVNGLFSGGQNPYWTFPDQ